MKFDPITNELYTDQGQFVKRLYCPFKVERSDMEKTSLIARKCSICKHDIIDTAFLSDEDLLKTVETNKNTCFKLNFNQNNLTIK